ncbi:MAG: type II toxin-antitoxin system prevent-host-death family antitoxin [Mariprofundus sp.]|nr:type II toxin-antitoxin system prevent-host-death family antitoxin [Mariprofundus sp.]
MNTPYELHQQVSTCDAKTHLSALLRAVQQGQSFTITRRGKPVACLQPVHSQFGQVSGLLVRFQALRQRIDEGGS